MSEHHTAGAGANRPFDHPTTQSPPAPYPGQPIADPDGEAPTRAFAGFRTERRQPRPDAEGRHDPRRHRRNAALGFPTVTGIPQVDPAGFGGYYGDPAEAPARPARPSYRPERVPHSPYPELSTDVLLRPVKQPPSQGWRRLLYELSGQLINLGDSPRAARYNDLVAQVNKPLSGLLPGRDAVAEGRRRQNDHHRDPGVHFRRVAGRPGGGGGRQPRPRHPSQKVQLETVSSVRQLLHDAAAIERYSDVRRYTSQGPSGLEVLASESDPAVSDPFSADDYARALQVLEQFYGLVLTDCGTGLLHSAMSSVLAKADVLIVLSSGSIDGARSASATLDWLEAHGHEDLVRNAIVVINAVRRRTGNVDMNKVIDHFARRCRAVRLVPHDPHLEEGAEISLDRLRRPTREALTELAAVVADGFPNDPRHNPALA